MFIAVDPSFHQTPVNFGRVLKSLNVTQLPSAECPIAMLGSVAHVDCNKLSALVLDNRQLPDTKWHKLLIRTDSFVSASECAAAQQPGLGSTHRRNQPFDSVYCDRYLWWAQSG